MKIRKGAVFSAALAAFVLIYFARPIYIHRTSEPTPAQDKCLKAGQPDDPRSLPRPDESGIVKVIEMTGLGEFADRCQITDALYALNWDRKTYYPKDFHVVVKDGAVPKSKLAILYIHGWHNDANPKGGDLFEFTNLTKRIAGENADKQVVGIYISWPANSTIPIWHYLDFWQKKGIADRVAASGNVTNVIAAASEIITRSEVGGRFITIGHSFGARILMASTIQSAIVATQVAHPGRPFAPYKEVKSLAQTAIFLNPAFEASYFTPIAAFDRLEEPFPAVQKPVLMTIATDNDYATSIAFPAGQWLAWRTGAKDTNTLGNYEPYWTHTLDIQGASYCRGVHARDGLTEQFSAAGSCLRRENAGAYNPFMVVRTNSKILSGHNGIWNKNFVGWLFRYLDELAKQLPEKTEVAPK